MSVWKEEILFTAGRNTNRYNQYGDQCGGSSKTWTLTYYITQLYHSLAHNKGLEILPHSYCSFMLTVSLFTTAITLGNSVNEANEWITKCGAFTQ